MTGQAPGAPGIGATWSSSAKDLVTTALTGQSRVWLTLGHGIGNEIYWPSTGRPQLRDLGFLVHHNETWVEVKRSNRYRLETPGPALLVPRVVHIGDGWELRLDWIVDPNRDVVLVDYELTGEADALVVLVAPHLGAGEYPNTAWVDEELHAVSDGVPAALTVRCSAGFRAVSAGYVGVSDGWQDLVANGARGGMSWHYARADVGNVAMTGEIPLVGTLAVGIADTIEGATVLARSSLAEGARAVGARFLDGWERFATELDLSGVPPEWRWMAGRSAAVLACHEDRTFPGAVVASLSIPWGNQRSDLGGYHLVWARDAAECALGRLALGDRAAADRTVRWLVATQQPDGHWTQNAFPDGRAFWTGVQLDEVALPVVLAAAAKVDRDDAPVRDMVRRAVGYLVRHGPASEQDRWEENAGTNAFTLAVVVAALVVARRWLEPSEAEYCEALADYWNARVEDWLYARGGELAEGRGIEGYYVRLGRADEELDACGRIDVRNRIGEHPAPDELIACDFLALVRFGLRRADDRRVVDTVRLIDEVLAVELPTGVAYRRYNGDGYGEHADGTPFDGTGIGRPWPLLTGERGHYAYQAGEDPSPYLRSMVAMAGPGQLLPEQVWDAATLAERLLETGRPTGSAMPLAWAHAEFVKLATCAARGRPIEMLDEVVARYSTPRSAQCWFWRVDAPLDAVPAGVAVVVDHEAPFELQLGAHALSSAPTALGRHGLRIEPSMLPIDADLACRDRTWPVRVRIDG
ncbi:MAG: hypothetical protein KDB21_02880 [Acidimicrobiales bacterium]|nr:hypothetical protein [Acidimicrobiales bacterium]